MGRGARSAPLPYWRLHALRMVRAAHHSLRHGCAVRTPPAPLPLRLSMSACTVTSLISGLSTLLSATFIVCPATLTSPLTSPLTPPLPVRSVYFLSVFSLFSCLLRILRTASARLAHIRHVCVQRFHALHLRCSPVCFQAFSSAVRSHFPHPFFLCIQRVHFV